MKVYISKYIGGYGGGNAIVAANNEEEALRIAAESDDFCLFRDFDYAKHEYYVKLSPQMTPFKEIPKVHYDGVNPCLISMNIYYE